MADTLRLFGGRTATDYRAALGSAGVDGHPHPLLKPLYDSLLDHRQQLANAALAAVRALLDYDEQVLSRVVCQQPQSAPRGLAEAVRACAPLITCKGDWAALYMLCQERRMPVGYTDLCRTIAAEAPEAPQPRRQDLAQCEWDTHRRRFPDWQPEGVRYDKFRRHYAIAARAVDLLTDL